MKKHLGTIPEGDIRLEDGRLLQSLETDRNGIHGWTSKDGLAVLADWIFDPKNPTLAWTHISIFRLDRPPSQDDIRLVCKVFFGDLPIDDSQVPEILAAAPNFRAFQPRHP